MVLLVLNRSESENCVREGEAMLESTLLVTLEHGLEMTPSEVLDRRAL